MERTVNAIKTLRKTLTHRNNELENLLETWEDRLVMAEEETAEYESLCKLCHEARAELRLNKRLLEKLSLCEYCKLSNHNLCGEC